MRNKTVEGIVIGMVVSALGFGLFHIGSKTSERMTNEENAKNSIYDTNVTYQTVFDEGVNGEASFEPCTFVGEVTYIFPAMEEGDFTEIILNVGEGQDLIVIIDTEEVNPYVELGDTVKVCGLTYGGYNSKYDMSDDLLTPCIEGLVFEVQ